jgi:phage baseplate assembly protein gpV
MGTIQIDGSTPKLTIGNATAEDATILFDGNAQDFYIALDDSADDLLIGLGSTVGTTPAISIDENLAVKTYGDITMTGTTPVLTIGDAGAEDTAIVFDGNAQDFYIALDDSADDLVIGLGSTVGTTPAISINEDRDVTISDGAIDFDVASHDGTNGLKLGGTLVTTTAAELNLLDGDTSVGSSITVADADGFVVNDGGTMKTIPATDITTYVGGGITMLDQWVCNAIQNISADTATVITGNWVDYGATDSGASIGSAMTESSGIFTFPSTGVYAIDFLFQLSEPTDANDNVTVYLYVTTDNGSVWSDVVDPGGFFADAGSAHPSRWTGTGHFALDVTDTTNVKVKFHVYSSVDAELWGHGSRVRSYACFTRLGDT